MKENKRKKFNKLLGDIQKRYTLPKCDRTVNKSWKKEWGPLLKYDHDWDWAYFFDIILYKIEKMKAYQNTYSRGDESWINHINTEMNEVLALGNKLKEHDYDEEWYKYSKEHTISYVTIYKTKKPIDKKLSLAEKLDLVFGEEIAKIAFPKGEEFATKKEVIDKYCVEHNLNRKEITLSFGADWDSEENYETYKELQKKAAEEEQADYDKFFLLISKYMRGWWD